MNYSRKQIIPTTSENSDKGFVDNETLVKITQTSNLQKSRSQNLGLILYAMKTVFYRSHKLQVNIVSQSTKSFVPSIIHIALSKKQIGV